MPVRETVTIRFDANASDFFATSRQVRAELQRLERDLNRASGVGQPQGGAAASIARQQQAQAAALRNSLQAQRQAYLQAGFQQTQAERQVGQQRLQSQRQTDRLRVGSERQAGNQQLEVVRQTGRQRLQAQRQTDRLRIQSQQAAARREIALLQETGRQQRFEQQRADRVAREAERRLNRPSTFRRILRATGPILPLASLYGIAQLSRGVARLSDDWTILTNRVQLYTDSIEETEQVQQGLFESSQEARVGLTATAEVYQRLAAGNDTLRLSQEQLIAISETLNRAVTISGVGAETANAALVQLGQGLASGELRGQELRSVLEQIPRVAQILSDHLGVTRGELLALGAAGQLTSATLVAAFESQAATIEREFARINPTIEQGGTVLNNSFTRGVGIINEVTGASNALAASMISVAMNIDAAADAIKRLSVAEAQRQRLSGQAVELGLDVLLPSPDTIQFFNRAIDNLGLGITSINNIDIALGGVLDRLRGIRDFQEVGPTDLELFRDQGPEQPAQVSEEALRNIQLYTQALAEQAVAEAELAARQQAYNDGLAARAASQSEAAAHVDALIEEGEIRRVLNLRIEEEEQAVSALAAARLDLAGAVGSGLFDLGILNEVRVERIEGLLVGVQGLRQELDRLRPEQVAALDAALQQLSAEQIEQVIVGFQQAQHAQEQWRRTGVDAVNQVRDSVFDLIFGIQSAEEALQNFLQNIGRQVFNNIFDQLTADLTRSILSSTGSSSGSTGTGGLFRELLQAAPAVVATVGAGGAGKRTAPLLEQHVTIIGNPNPNETRQAVRQGGRELLREGLATAGGREILSQAREEEED